MKNGIKEFSDDMFIPVEDFRLKYLGKSRKVYLKDSKYEDSLIGNIIDTYGVTTDGHTGGIIFEANGVQQEINLMKINWIE